jgi:hypothetical protein
VACSPLVSAAASPRSGTKLIWWRCRRSHQRSSLGPALICCPSIALAARRKFVFKIKTKSGGIIGNIVIEAKDSEAVKHKLRQRYPDCEIWEMAEK